MTSKTLTCTPIVDQDGKNIENSDSTTWVNKSKDFGSDMQKKIEEYWIIIIGIIVGIIVLTGLIMLLRSLRKWLVVVEVLHHQQAVQHKILNFII